MSAAATQVVVRRRRSVSRQEVFYFLVRGYGRVPPRDAAFQPPVGAHYHRIAAVRALAGLFIDECMLQRVRFTWLADPFQGSYGRTGRHFRHRGDTRAGNGAVDDDCAAAALRHAATEPGTDEVELVAEDIQQVLGLIGHRYGLPLTVYDKSCTQRCWQPYHSFMS